MCARRHNTKLCEGHDHLLFLGSPSVYSLAVRTLGQSVAGHVWRLPCPRVNDLARQAQAQAASRAFATAESSACECLLHRRPLPPLSPLRLRARSFQRPQRPRMQDLSALGMSLPDYPAHDLAADTVLWAEQATQNAEALETAAEGAADDVAFERMSTGGLADAVTLLDQLIDGEDVPAATLRGARTALAAMLMAQVAKAKGRLQRKKSWGNEQDVSVRRGTPRITSATMRAAGMRAAGMRAAGMQAAGMRAAGMRAAGMRAAGMRAAGMRAAGMRAAGMQGDCVCMDMWWR
eukprot:365228-Chlamydomonas_euryale.AAC.33